VKRLALALLVAFFGTSVRADVNTDAAGDFLVTCAKRLPETKKTVQVLKDEGWRYESSDGRFHFYSQNGRRVLAATTVTSAPQQGCFSAVARLTKAGAISIGKSTAKSLGLAPITDDVEPGVDAAWGGVLNGHKVMLAAMPSADFGYIRGASLILVQE
jgi:hypothetical protein